MSIQIAVADCCMVERVHLLGSIVFNDAIVNVSEVFLVIELVLDLCEPRGNKARNDSTNDRDHESDTECPQLNRGLI